MLLGLESQGCQATAAAATTRIGAAVAADRDCRRCRDGYQRRGAVLLVVGSREIGTGRRPSAIGARRTRRTARTSQDTGRETVGCTGETHLLWGG